MDDKWSKAAKIYRRQNAEKTFDFPAQVQKLQEFLKKPGWRELLEESRQQILIGHRKTELGSTFQYYLTHEGLRSKIEKPEPDIEIFFMMPSRAEDVVDAAYQYGITDVTEFIKVKLDEIADEVL